MTVSLANSKSRFDEAKAASTGVVRATVTGVDVKGQMFRHSVTVLMLDGYDCEFRSKSQPELDGSVLVEFDYREADPKRRVSQARVRSNDPEKDSDTYKVAVELEVAQTVKVAPDQSEPQTAVQQPAPPPIPTSGPENNGHPIAMPREFRLPTSSKGIPQELSHPNRKNNATVEHGSPKLPQKTEVHDPIALNEAVKSAVALEIKQQILLLRTWISSELERILPAIVSSSMEKMICEAVEKQVSVNSQTFVQAANSDVSSQVEDRIAESNNLRMQIEGNAKKFFEEQAELSRTAQTKVEQELGSRAARIMRTFEELAAKVESRINAAQVGMEQAEGRIAESNGLRMAFEDNAKKFFEEQAELSRTAQSKAEQELSSRAATIMRTFEELAAKVEARINSAHQAGMEQAERRIAECNDLRMALEGNAKKFFEDQAELSRMAGAKVEQAMSLRAATIMRTIEELAVKVDAGINAAHVDIEVVQTRTQALLREINDDVLPLQEAMERLNNAERAGLENFQKQTAAQLSIGAAEFENQLTKIASERVAQCAMEMEEHLAPHRQCAEEAVAKLGAVLQLMQGTSRVQQERLTEHSRATAANFEKEIRALLLRLAGGA